MEERYVFIDPSSSSSPSSSRNLPNVTFVDSPVSDGGEPVYSTVIPRSLRQPPSPQPPIPPRTHPVQQINTNSQSHMTGHVTNTSNTKGDTSQLRLQYLESIVARLEKEKKAMEEEFGRQRKKFMSQMMQTESDINLTKQSLSQHIKEIEDLHLKLLGKEKELKSCQQSISEFQSERLKYNEDILSLKHMIQVSSHEHNVQMERSKAEWQNERKALESQKTQLLLEKQNLLAANQTQKGREKGTEIGRSKSPNRSKGDKGTEIGRSKSPNHGRTKSPSDELKMLVSTDVTKSLLQPPLLPEDASTCSINDSSSAVNFTSESSLESSMIEAAKESQLLRSVVVPLEEEIDLLKMKLKEAQERLTVYEKNYTPSYQTHLPVSGISSNIDEASSKQVSDISETELLQKILNQERAARHDLEMHSEGLRRQKTILLNNIEDLKEQFKQAKEEHIKEHESYIDLKKTWECANLQFIASQDKLREELQEIQHQLNQEKLAKEIKLRVTGGVSPSHSSSPVHDHVTNSDNHFNRKRSVTWSEGLKHGDRETSQARDEELLSWKDIVKHLQRLIVGLREELNNKERMCEEYEQQLERVQGQLTLELEDKEKETIKLKGDHDKIYAVLVRERKSREDLRRQLNAEREEMKTRIEQFQSQENKVKQKFKTLKDKFTETKHETQKQVTQFTEERVKMYELLEQRKEEYDCLKTLQASEIEEYQEKLSQIEQTRREAEWNVASTMEELTKSTEREKENEMNYSKELTELKQLLSHSRQERQRLSEQLGALQSDLIDVQRTCTRLEKECNDVKTSRSVLQEKSKTFIEEQQQQISQLTAEKVQLNDSVMDLHRQLTQLKQQLQHNEATQKDFVELSQSLQVRLLEMEAKQNKQVEGEREGELLTFSNTSP